MKIDKELRQAIVKEQFCLYYQPVIDLASGHILGAEALIRWNHPTQGLVGPDQFIRVAEDSDLIIPIGEWVIASAAHQAAKWNKISKQVLKVAINISSRQCGDNGKSIVKTLTKIVADEQLEPGMLEVEITESLLMGGEAKTINALQEIRDIGIGISLDDFGTGYSSLSYLKHFPISTIKIDRSFIRDVNTDKKDAQLVHAILMMGKGLEIDVIGEGIEEPEHLAFLKQYGCKAGQGYYFSRPLPVHEFEAYLLQQGAIADDSVTATANM
ncbi:MAG: EAL domain-containing protein [Nitrosomonas sp.]|nr:EAL domain-containing protein [Nitrosomonas sp.]